MCVCIANELLCLFLSHCLPLCLSLSVCLSLSFSLSPSLSLYYIMCVGRQEATQETITEVKSDKELERVVFFRHEAKGTAGFEYPDFHSTIPPLHVQQ